MQIARRLIGITVIRTSARLRSFNLAKLIVIPEPLFNVRNGIFMECLLRLHSNKVVTLMLDHSRLEVTYTINASRDWYPDNTIIRSIRRNLLITSTTYGDWRE